MKATSARRQLAMAVLLTFAVLGALMRYWAPNPSLTRDIGTLLLVLWVPAIGNVIAFLVRRTQEQLRHRAGFDAKPQFTPHLKVRLAPVPAQAALIAALSPQQRECAVILGSDGFSARTQGALAQLLRDGNEAHAVALEFLKPALALPRLSPGTGFHLVVGNTAIAEGTVEGASGDS